MTNHHWQAEACAIRQRILSCEKTTDPIQCCIIDVIAGAACNGEYRPPKTYNRVIWQAAKYLDPL